MPKGEKKARYPQLAEPARRMIEDDGVTQRETAERLGLNRTTVERWCRRFGWRTQRTGPRAGSGHPNWLGGHRMIGRYWYRYCPEHPHATLHRVVAEHRLVMEGMLGRFLDPHEVVHHRDGDPTNNDPENLVLFQTNGAHLRAELTGRTPRWTPDGLRRVEAAIAKAAAIRRASRSDDRQRPLPIDHPASSA